MLPGNPAHTAESSRNLGTFPLLETLGQDLRYGLRQLRRNPGFTIVAVLTLALGIGTSTAIFSVLDGVLLKPLPYPHPEQLVGVWHSAPGINVALLNVSPSSYFIYREQNRTFQDIGIYQGDSVNITGVAQPEQVGAVDVTDGLLPVLGVTPMLGRLFTTADDSPGSAETVMLTYGYWARKFGGDRSVIGKTMTLDGKLHQIIGVLPREFDFMGRPGIALFLPLKFDRAKLFLGQFSYEAIARLRPGVTLAQANADVARMVPIMLRSFPAPPGFSLKMFQDARIGPNVRPLKQDVVGDVGKVLWVLMGGIGLVLLIACANVANLLLVRAEGRQQEFGIRAALGASRGRIAAELLFESLILALAGSLLGLGLAYGALRILVAVAPAGLPRLNEIAIDGTVVLFALAMSMVASLLFGSVPVVKYTGARLGTDLHESRRSMSASRERHRARSTLVIAQVALALVLLISSGLMIRTFLALTRVDPGFVGPSTLQTLRISISENEVKDPQRVVHMQEEILHKIEAIPGVSSAAISRSVPMDGNHWSDPVFAKDRTYSPGKLPLRIFEFVAPGYFKTSGTPFVAGRDFTWSDLYNKHPVAIVSEKLAREYWQDPSSALGKQIRVSTKDDWREVVGVVGDVRDEGMDKEAPALVYWPLLMNHFEGDEVNVRRGVAFSIRSPRAGSRSLMNEVQRAVWSVDSNLPLAEVHTLEYYCRRSIARTSFTLVMLGLAGSMALLLGIIGLYAVMSYSVSQRTHEVGIRMALGAEKRDVLNMVVGQGLRLALMGVALGVAGAFALTRFLTSLLYGVKPSDPLTFIVVSLILIAVALAACYIPARRAAKVDPMVALRYE
ncbi:MAG TPA: ABC transporter permease [Terriglobia bacterium]|nr:ABC transporter permease [Terriglobia bacterium]